MNTVYASPLFDGEIDKPSTHASILAYARGGIALIGGSGLQVPLEKIDEAVSFLQRKGAVEIIQVYVQKKELLDVVKCPHPHGADHYTWEEEIITYSRTPHNYHAWFFVSSVDLEQCPVAEPRDKRVKLVREQLEEMHRQQEAHFANLPPFGPSGPPDEGEPEPN
jgi:hypothetical protein